ncbi:hypothetical protein ACFL0Y_01570 [Patescibacteria group bacterium]
MLKTSIFQNYWKWFKQKIILLTLLVLGSVLVFYLSSNYLFQETKSQKLSQDQTLSWCKKDNDCVLAINLDRCCSCPEPVLSSKVESDKKLVVYQDNINFALERSLDCSQANCPPCSLLEGARCRAQECEGVAKEAANSKTAGWLTYQNFDLGFKVKHPQGVRVFEDRQRVSLKLIDGNIFGFFIQVSFPIVTEKRTPKDLAYTAFELEKDQVESYGGDFSQCEVTIVERGINKGYRIDFCSDLAIKVSTIPQFSEWYEIQGKIVQVDGKLSSQTYLGLYELILSTLEFLDDSQG